MGIHLLIPFTNWLAQENRKSEQHLLRRPLGRRALPGIGDRIFKTRGQGRAWRMETSRRFLKRKDRASSDTGKRAGLDTEERL